MADHDYGVEHSGNTPGADTLIVLNGPIIKELGFNFEQDWVTVQLKKIENSNYQTILPSIFGHI